MKIALTDVRIQSKKPIVINRGNPADDDVEWEETNIDLRGSFECDDISQLKEFLNLIEGR